MFLSVVLDDLFIPLRTKRRLDELKSNSQRMMHGCSLIKLNHHHHQNNNGERYEQSHVSYLIDHLHHAHLIDTCHAKRSCSISSSSRYQQLRLFRPSSTFTYFSLLTLRWMARTCSIARRFVVSLCFLLVDVWLLLHRFQSTETNDQPRAFHFPLLRWIWPQHDHSRNRNLSWAIHSV